MAKPPDFKKRGPTRLCASGEHLIGARRNVPHTVGPGNPHTVTLSGLSSGTLHHVRPDIGDFAERFDPQPWMESERDAWLIIEPFSITGRRLRSPQPQWTFHVRGYL